MNPFKMMLLTALLALCAAGCSTTKIKFNAGARYASPYQPRESAVVALPDYIVDKKIKIKIGKLWEAAAYEIPVMDAYKAEVAARMRGMFQKVTLTTTELLDEVEPEMRAEGEAESTPEVTSRELDELLDSMEAGEPEPKKGKKKSNDNEWMEERLYESSKEELRTNRDAIRVRFEDALLGFPDGQAVVRFRVRLIDGRTGHELLHKWYDGRSSTFRPYRNTKSNEDAIIRHVKEAFSGPMQQLCTDIAEHTGATR